MPLRCGPVCPDFGLDCRKPLGNLVGDAVPSVLCLGFTVVGEDFGRRIGRAVGQGFSQEVRHIHFA